MVIWVPEGDVEDKTRLVEELDVIAVFLSEAGARTL
jgi:hypothetical protein